MTQPLPPQTNPLAEASPSSLEELFARDPRGLTDENVQQVCEYLREMRAKFRERDAPKAKRASAPVDPNVTLEDLGF